VSSAPFCSSGEMLGMFFSSFSLLGDLPPGQFGNYGRCLAGCVFRRSTSAQQPDVRGSQLFRFEPTVVTVALHKLSQV